MSGPEPFAWQLPRPRGPRLPGQRSLGLRPPDPLTGSPADLPNDLGAWRFRLDRHAPAGSGRRAIRRIMASSPCCRGADPTSLEDGRIRCGSCGCSWSASHSGSLVAVVRGREPVGVDVQEPRVRPAALRTWGARCAVPDAALAHWVLGEACLKAAGLAGALPEPGVLSLPASPGPFGRSVLADGRTFSWCWGDAATDPEGCFWALAWQTSSAGPAARSP